MTVRSNTLTTFAASVSLCLIVSCGGGGDGGTPAPSPGPGTDPIETGAAATGPLSGPRTYQTGNTAVSGLQENIAFGGFSIPFTYTTDTATNTTGDGLPSNDTPDVVYDENGRGIEIQVSASSLPIIVTYNDDDSIATITKTRSSGTMSRIDFNYEDGKLINKTNTFIEVDGTEKNEGGAVYTYDANGHVASAEVLTESIGFLIPASFEFITDSAGRVTRAQKFDRDGDPETLYGMTYDANGNIVKVEWLDGQGGAAIRWTYTYTTSSEPTVNLLGFFAAMNDAFIPEYDLLVF